MNIEKMTPEEFQDYMDELKVSHPREWNYVMDYYFDDVRDEEKYVLKSWENDYDDVWDAQAYLQEKYGD